MKTLIFRIKDEYNDNIKDDDEREAISKGIRDGFKSDDLQVVVVFGDGVDFYSNDPEFRLLEPSYFEN